MLRLALFLLGVVALLPIPSAVSAPVPEKAEAPKPFATRTAPLKSRLIEEHGSAESEAAVAEGLAWLAKQQQKDGGWAYDAGNNFKDERVAATGMAVLAFLGAGEDHKTSKKYAKTVQNGLNFLASNCPLNGNNAGKFAKSGTMYSQAIGTLALCEGYGMTADKAFAAPAQTALNYIQRGQGANGSWGYAAGNNGDTSIVGWQVQALQTARQGKGLVVDPKVLKRTVGFLDSATAGKNKAVYGYIDNAGAAPGTSLTAIGLWCRQTIDGWGPDHDGITEGVTGLMKRRPTEKGRLDTYYYYYASRVVFAAGGDEWKTWNEGPKGQDGTRKGGMRDWLVGLQVKKEGANLGSWDPDAGFIGASCGRLGTTCLCLLTLEVYYRYPVPAPAKEKDAPKKP